MCENPVLTAGSRYTSWNDESEDSLMTDYEKEIWAELRRIFHQPYLVLKVKGGPNDSGLSWNPDFWVQKGNKTILIIKALEPETTLENFDARMRDAFAVMALNWETSKHGAALSATARAVIVPDKVLDQLGHEGYLKYHYAFEPFDCEIIRRSAIAELELYREQADRRKSD